MRVTRGATLLTLVVAASAGVAAGPPAAQRAAALDVDVFRELAWRRLGPSGDAPADMLSASVDAAFPARVCGVERGVGPVCVSTAPGLELVLPGGPPGTSAGSMAVPDPSDPEIVFSDHLVRYDRRTGQAVPVPLPRGARAMFPAGAPLGFGRDGRTLFAGARALWQSDTGGRTWTVASPDLTGEPPPSASGRADGLPVADAAAISALGLSVLDERIIWAGTGLGHVHVTWDRGDTWLPVAPSSRAGAVRSLEASHFDRSGAYLVADGRGPGVGAVVLRTRDGGESWQVAMTGLESSSIHVVREDTRRRGLLVAGSDDGLFVSFDDGDRWQPWSLNLPPVPIRDVMVAGDDLIVATGGRGFWILDDISPLRQVTPDVLEAPLFLASPAPAWRYAAAAGPVPAGRAAFDYAVGESLTASLTLEVIATTTGERLRVFSSTADGEDGLDSSPGLHRRVWDLRYASPGSDPVSGVPLPGARVPIGAYQVRLSTGEHVLRQAVAIRLDPRVTSAPADVAAHDTMARAVGVTLGALRSALAAEPASPEAPRVAASIEVLGALAWRLDAFDERPTPAMIEIIDAALADAERALDATR